MLIEHLKIGFLGAGTMAQTIVRRIVDSKMVKPERIWISNRSYGKVAKLVENYPGLNAASTNEEMVENSDIVIIAVKPQDFVAAVEPLNSIFREKQVIVSLAAGIDLKKMARSIPQGRLARVMPNTPSVIGRGVIGYCVAKQDDAAASLIEELLKPLGYIVALEDGEEFDTLLVAASSGTGFVLELMSYWQDWIEERGFEPAIARKMVVETFLGAALLAEKQGETKFLEMVQRVASKKGVTQAGLDSMRENEVERVLRIGFEKASMRNVEIFNEIK